MNNPRLTSLIATGVTDALAVVSNLPNSGTFTHDFGIVVAAIGGIMTLVHFHLPALVTSVIKQVATPATPVAPAIDNTSKTELTSALNEVIAVLGKVSGS